MAKIRLVAVAVILTIPLVPTAAQAQVECNRLVNDQAKVFGNGAPGVQAAAERVAASSALVRVVTFRSVGGDIDEAKRQVEADCGWDQPNQLLVMMSLEDRRSGIYFGDNYRSRLDDRWETVRLERMNPRFRQGDFAGGIIATLDRLGQLITGPEPVDEPVQPDRPEKPTDYSGLWRFLRWFAVALIGLALLVTGFMMVRDRLRKRRTRQATQREAQVLQVEAGLIYFEINRIWPDIQNQTALAIGSVCSDDGEALRGRLNQIEAENNRLTEAYDRANDGPNPDDKLDAEAYRAITETYRPLKADLIQQRAGMLGLKQEAERLVELIDELPRRFDSITTEIAQAEASRKEIEGQGFKTNPISVKQAEATLTSARSALGEKRIQQAADWATTASEQAQAARREYEGLPGRRQDLLIRLSQLQAGLANGGELIVEGRRNFDVISTEYAEVCWQSVSGNGSQSELHLAAGNTLASDAEKLLSMSRQDWAGAEGRLNQAQTELDRLASLMKSISQLKQNLDQARDGAASDLAQAESDHEAAARFIDQFDEDIDEALENHLDQAEPPLVQAKRELAELKPDYLTVIALIKQAQEQIGQVLKEAHSQHQAMERLRQQVASQLRDAKASISKAYEYIEDHSSDIGHSAETLLNSARTLLNRAEATNDLEEQLGLATRAEADADQAYSQARRDHQAAEDEREAERQRRYRSSRSSYSSSSGYGGGFSSGSFGGSFGGGSFGGGGGGSSGGGSGGW